MPKVHYVAPSGGTTTLDAPVGKSVMLTALHANLNGIIAECGGCLTCATCHVYVDAAWLDRVPPASADEQSMLDFTAAARRPESRLSCQITMTPELDGLVVRLPDTQT